MEDIKIKFDYQELHLAMSFITYCDDNNINTRPIKNNDLHYIVAIDKESITRLSDYLLADGDNKSLNRIIKSML